MSLNRRIAPPTAGFGDLKLPPVKSVPLENGSVLNLLPDESTDAVRLSIAWHNGTRDAQNLEASTLMPALFEDGGGDFSGEEITRELDFNGASFNAGTGSYALRCYLTSIPKNYCRLLPMIGQMLLRPTFPQAEITNKSSALRANLEVFRRKLSTIAYMNSLAAVWGKAHPGSRIIDLDRLSGLKQSDLAEIHRQFILESTPTLWLSGKITAEILKETELFADSFPKVPGISQKKIVPMHPDSGTIIEETVPDKDQSYIQITIPAINVDHPDFYPLSVAVTHLGGYFGSRLMSNIREKKGLTYGINSSLTATPAGAFITITCQTGAGNEQTVIDEIKNEIRSLTTNPPTGLEMTSVKRIIESELATQLDSVFSVTSLLMGNYEFGIPESAYEARLNAVRNTTSEQIGSLVEKHINPETMIISIARGSGSIK